MDDSIALMFNNHLQKISSQSSRKNTQLREACKFAQDTIRDSPVFSKTTTTPTPTNTSINNEQPSSSSSSQPKYDLYKEYELLGNKIFIPMKLACETKEPKIMAIALDCLDKLMAYGIIRSPMQDESTTEKKKLIESVVETIGSYFAFQDDNVQIQIIKALLTSVITPICDVHDTCLMNSIRTCYNIYLVSTNKINSSTAKSALFQMVDYILQRFENISQQKMNSTLGEDGNQIYQSNLSDVILLFRAFCKLSTKDVPDGIQPESHEMKSKILSLELLSRILENPLPSLKLSEKFINSSIKRYLSISLLTNGNNTHIPVFKLTLTLFLSLIIHFKEHLKEEIGIFFSKILLKVLSSNSCSTKQKWLILPVLYEICKNPQTIVDIFVNYDCDPDRKDIFEKMVYELSRVAQGTIIGDQRTSSNEDMKFKTLGLECMVTIMKSLVDWSRELYEIKKITGPTTTTSSSGKSTTNKLSSSTSGTPRKSNPNNSTPSPTSLTIHSEDDENSDKEPIPKLPTNNSLNMEEFKKQKEYKHLLEQSKQKFNVSPKKGIQFLVKCGISKETPEDIASFLKSDDLDPKRIGEYLGVQNTFNQSVLQKYIDSYNFKGISIDLALRDIMSCFLLQEQIVIDKVLERFAAKFYNENPNSYFSNAGKISKSIIALYLDLHNPVNSNTNIKLTKQDWIKMNEKNNDKKNFDETFLNEIYDRIALEPFKLRFFMDDISFFDTQEKIIRFNKESDYIVKQCQELIKAKLSKKSVFYKARNIEHVRPMFLLSWCYVLSTLSVVLDDTKDKKVISLCLEGFSYAIRVSCIFYMNVERSSFITALSKFSFLDNIKEPNLKNIECVKILISIGLSEGNYLQDSWSSILKTICILERFHLIDGASPTSSISTYSTSTITTSGESSSSNNNNGTLSNIEIQIKKLMEENPKEVSFDSSQVERIFTNTVLLSDDSILIFFKCLCEVSDDEINHYQRIYSLIKLVEVIDYNLKRIRLVFYNIWEIVVQHFIKIGSYSNNEIALHAIDSLRQLASKYLEKQELAHYNFQNEFLNPFENIMINNPSFQIKELIIRCVNQLSFSKAQNIRSGWKTILNVLSLGSQVIYEPIVGLAFSGIEKIIQNHFSIIEENYFLDVINCLSSFCSPSVQFFEISLKSLDSLKFLSEKIISHMTATPNEDDTNRLLAVIDGLSQSITHDSEAVRSSSINICFEIFNNIGLQFTPSIWSRIFKKVLLPIFSKFDLQKKEFTEFEQNWIKQTCPIYLDELIKILNKYPKELNEFYSSFLNLLIPFVCNGKEFISTIGCNYFCKFINDTSQNFTPDFWNQSISESIDKIIIQLLFSKLSNQGQKAFNKQLITLKPFQLTANESTLIGKEMYDNLNKYEKIEPFLSQHHWDVSILFMQKISSLFIDHYHQIPFQFCINIIKYWDGVYLLSQRVNSEANFVSYFQNNSNRFETGTLSFLLELLFHMYLDQSYPDRQAEAEDILSRLTLGIFKEFTVPNLYNSGPKLTKIVCQIIQGYSKFSEPQFTKHVSLIFPFVVDLSLNDNVEVRSNVVDLWLKQKSIYGKGLLSSPDITPPPVLPLVPMTTIKPCFPHHNHQFQHLYHHHHQYIHQQQLQHQQISKIEENQKEIEQQEVVVEKEELKEEKEESTPKLEEEKENVVEVEKTNDEEEEETKVEISVEQEEVKETVVETVDNDNNDNTEIVVEEKTDQKENETTTISTDDNHENQQQQQQSVIVETITTNTSKTEQVEEELVVEEEEVEQVEQETDNNITVEEESQNNSNGEENNNQQPDSSNSDSDTQQPSSTISNTTGNNEMFDFTSINGSNENLAELEDNDEFVTIEDNQ
eukprot:gene3871-4825_t